MLKKPRRDDIFFVSILENTQCLNRKEVKDMSCDSEKDKKSGETQKLEIKKGCGCGCVEKAK